jgi:hypothetical protein
VEGLGNYAASVTALFEEVRVDWLRVSWQPSANIVYGTALAALPVVTAIYSGPDNYTHSYSGLAVLQDAKLHKYSSSVSVTWKIFRNSADNLTFYPTTGTGISHVIPDLGGVLAFMSYTWSGAAQIIGLFTAEYGLSLKGFRQ